MYAVVRFLQRGWCPVPDRQYEGLRTAPTARRLGATPARAIPGVTAATFD
jgi:hypothetical protein